MTNLEDLSSKVGSPTYMRRCANREKPPPQRQKRPDARRSGNKSARSKDKGSFGCLQQIEAATRDLSKEAVYLVGVSGGLDSRILLALLVELGFGHLVVCHLNHNLRQLESAHDCLFVKRICRDLGLEFHSNKLTGLPNAGSMEASARLARLHFFAQASKKFRTKHIFLGHHADDQVETFLFNLFRGTASIDNAAMKFASKIVVGDRELTFLRPMLKIPKENLRLFAANRQLAFREDSTNEDREMTRNRIRLDLIPTIENTLGRPIRPALLRAIEVGLAEADFIRSHVPDFSGCHELPVGQIRELAVAVQRRVVHAWLTKQNVKQFGFEEVEQVRSLLIVTKYAKVNLPGNLFCRRRAGRLFLEKIVKS